MPGSKKNLKVPPLFGCSVITIIIYILFGKKTTTKTKASWGTSARGADAPSHPTAPGLLLSVFRESTRGRERERERKKKSASFRIEKKKRGKEGSDETTRGGAHPRIARAS